MHLNSLNTSSNVFMLLLFVLVMIGLIHPSMASNLNEKTAKGKISFNRKFFKFQREYEYAVEVILWYQEFIR